MTLQLIDIDHRYGKRQSLFGLSLTVERGDCFGLVGHNGAGKTTALRLALGLDRPRRGRICIDGLDAAREPLAVRACTGGMIESTGFYPWASGRNNLIELGRLAGLSGRDAKREADRWLDEVGLSAHARRRVGAYSHGMRQRLGLAQALLGEPRYALLDEPQNGLDPEGIADLRALLARLRQDHGVSIVLASHQLREVAGLCNRIGVLREGRLVLEAETEQLLASTRARHLLVTDAATRTREVLGGLGVRELPNENDRVGHTIELGDVLPRELVQRLVAAEVGVEQLTPRPTTLEEVYLRIAEGGAELPVSNRTAATPSAPDESAAPRTAPRPVVRMLVHDIRRHGLRWPPWVVLAIPSFLAWRRVHVAAADQAGDLAQVATGELFSTTSVTAFTALGQGLAAGIPALTVIAAAIASQSVAGDRGLGTLRNILLRPLRRGHVALGKALAVVAALLTALLGMTATAALSAAHHFDFGDCFEVTRDGEPELWIAAADVEPFLTETLLSPLLPLLAFCGIGFLVGTLALRAIWALSIALGAVVVLDVGRVMAQRFDAEAWLPSAYLPSPLGDRSGVGYFIELSIGSADAHFPHEETAILAPALWCGATFALAALRLGRLRSR